MVSKLSVYSSCLCLCSFCFWGKIFHQLNLEWYRQKLLAETYSRKKIAKFIMRTFTCRSTFLYGLSARVMTLSCPSPQSICHIFHKPFESGSSNTLYVQAFSDRTLDNLQDRNGRIRLQGFQNIGQWSTNKQRRNFKGIQDWDFFYSDFGICVISFLVMSNY